MLPNTAVQIGCSLSKSLETYITEPIPEITYLMPRILHSKGKDPVVCLLNISDRNVVLKKRMLVAKANEVDVAEMDQPSLNGEEHNVTSGTDVLDSNQPSVYRVETESYRQIELPEHMKSRLITCLQI